MKHKSESDIYIEILKKMTPQQKLQTSMDLYHSAWQLKTAWLKQLHPDWSEQKVHQTVKEIFSNAGK